MSVARDELQKKLQEYSHFQISEHVLHFFSEEKGLHPEMLITKDYFGRRAKYNCHMIGVFSSVIFPLIKFYRDTPGLSAEDLLNYSGYSIRDFAFEDKDFQFHRWILLHNLKIPAALVQEGPGGSSHNISSLCNSSGIEYLNRNILSHPQSEWQAKLDALVQRHCARDKEICLQDSLVPKHKAKPYDSVENRFLAFKKQEEVVANKFSQGPDSLFWLCAKKAAQITDQKQLDELPEDVQFTINLVKSLSK